MNDTEFMCVETGDYHGLARAWQGYKAHDVLQALKTLVSCIERDQGKGGILLPTSAALAHAKDVISQLENKC